MIPYTEEKQLSKAAAIAIIVAAVLFALSLASCRTTHEVEKVYIHDTIKQTSVLRDSIDRWHTHYEYIRGDTIVISDTFNAYKYVSIHDTLIQRDIEYRDKEVMKEVEKMVYVWWPFAAAFTVLLVFFWLWLKRIRK